MQGLVLCGQRWYAPAYDRWLSRDPAGYAGGADLYAYCGGNPVGEVDLGGCYDVKIKALGLEFTNNVVNSGLSVGLAATGSAASLHIWNGGSARFDPSFATSRALADVGVAAATSAIPVGSLCGGARSVFYSGEGALAAARAGKGAGMLIEDTSGGKLLDWIQSATGKELPRWVWKGASGVFAANAKGQVSVYLRSPSGQGMFLTIEKPILDALGVVQVLK